MKIDVSLHQPEVHIENSFLVTLSNGDTFRISEEEGKMRVAATDDIEGRLKNMELMPRAANAVLIGFIDD